MTLDVGSAIELTPTCTHTPSFLIRVNHDKSCYRKNIVTVKGERNTKFTHGDRYLGKSPEELVAAAWRRRLKRIQQDEGRTLL